MKTLKIEIFKDVTFMIGIVLIMMSLVAFMIPEWFPLGKSEGSDFGIFILNYLICITYFIILWAREISKFTIKNVLANIEYGFIHMVLCLISAYSLNRQIPVFQLSTSWLQVALITQGIILSISFLKNKLPVWLQRLYFSYLGITFSLFLYFSISVFF